LIWSPAQAVIKLITDGDEPASILVDVETVPDAVSYEFEWFTSSAMTPATKVGNKTTTKSRFTILGLTAGVQYWVRVRAVRADRSGPWSDPATRVANV